MLAEPVTTLRLNGSKGYGEGAFDPEEGTNVVKVLEDIKTCLSEHEDSAERIPDEVVGLVVSVSHHLDKNSFPTNGNGHSRDWAKARKAAQEIIEYSEQHNICGASEYLGYEKAKQATLYALKSGHVLDEVETEVNASGSSGLRQWFGQLHHKEREELNGIISKTAVNFWANLREKGYTWLENWKTEKSTQKPTSWHPAAQLQASKTNGSGHGRYNGSYHMGERIHQQPETRTLRDSDLTVEEVIAALTQFQQTLHQDVQQSPGRRPNRVERIINEVQESGSTTITLAQLEDRFANTKNPRATASSYISWLKKALEENGASIDIEPQVIYQFRSVSR